MSQMKISSSVAQSQRVLKVQEKMKTLNEEEAKKELLNLKKISENIEKSRVKSMQNKRKEILQFSSDKLNEKWKTKQLRLIRHNLLEQVSLKNKEDFQINKEKSKEKAIEERKYWNSQFNLYINEISQLQKADQEINFLKAKENEFKFKEKVLGKHKKKSIIVNQIREDQKHLDRIKEEIDMEILLQKERNRLTLNRNQRSIDQTYTRRTIEPTFMLTEADYD